MGQYFIFGLLDGFRVGQVRYMCGNACWMVGWVKKKREYVFFLACWMDLRLARFDICVERPVGWLDDQKTRYDTVVESPGLSIQSS